MKTKTQIKQKINLLSTILKGTLVVVATLFIGLIAPKYVHAATRTWDGGGSTNDWSECANWDGPDSCPGSSDVATFNSTSSKNATIDASFAGSVLGINITTGYSGTITQARSLTIGSSGYSQSTGTFTGSSDAINISGAGFSLTGGAFTSTSGTLSIDRNFTVSAGTWDANNGTVSFTNLSGSDSNDSTLSCTSVTFNAVSINKGSGNDTAVTIGSGCTLPIAGTNPTITIGLGPIVNNGTINVTGNLTIDGNADCCRESSYTQSTTATLAMTGTTFITEGNVVLDGGVFPTGLTTLTIIRGGLYLNQSTSPSPSGLTTLTIDRNLDNSQSKLPDGIALTLANAANNDASDTTLTCGTVTFGSVTINKGTGSDTAVVVGSTCSLPIAGTNPTITIGLGDITNNGTISVTGNLTIDGNADCCRDSSYTQSTTGTLTMTGTTITTEGDFILNGGVFPSGVTTLNIYRGGLYLNQSTSPSPSGLTTLSIDRNLDNSQNKLPNNIALSVANVAGGNNSSSLTCGNATFSSVSISKGLGSVTNVTIGSDCTVALTGTNPTTTIGFGTFTNNGVVSITGNWTLDGSIDCCTNSGGYLQNSGATLNMTGTTLTADGAITINGGSMPASLTTITVPHGSLTLGASAPSLSNVTTITVDRNLDNSNNKLANGVNVTLADQQAGSGNDSTLTCGSATLGSLTVNKGTTGADTTLNSDCTISGNFTRTDGQINNPGSALTFYVGGNFSMSTTDTFGGTNLTIEFNGSGTQTITQNAGTFNEPLRINKSTGSVQLSTNFTTTTSTCTVVQGIFNLNGKSFTCGSTFQVNANGSLQVQGAEAVTTPTLDAGSTVIYVGDGDGSADSLNFQNWTYSNLTINSTDGTTDNFGKNNTLVSGLQSYWKLDETTVRDPTNVSDAQSANQGTNQGNGPTPVADVPSNISSLSSSSRSFDGIDDYIYTATSYNNPTTFSLALWFKTTVASGAPMMNFENVQTGTGACCSDRSLLMGTDGKVRYGWYDGSTQSIKSDNTLNDGSWHHVVVVHDINSSPKVKMYIDGTEQAETGNSNPYSQVGYWRIGSYRGIATSNYVFGFFSGKLDDVRIYSTALTSGNVSSLYSGSNYTAGLQSYWALEESSPLGYFVEDEQNVNIGSLQGTGGSNIFPDPSTSVASAISGFSTRSRSFDGTDDYISTAVQYSNPQTFSISLWFNTNTANSNALFAFESNQTGGSGSWDRQLYVGSDGKIYFYWYDGGQKTINSVNAYNDGNWHNVVLTYDNAANPKINLYVDNGAAVTGNTSAVSYSGYWRMGNATGRNYYSGKLDDIRLYNAALNTIDVGNLYSGQNVTTSLLSMWAFEETTTGYPVVLDTQVANQGLVAGTTGTNYYPQPSTDHPNMGFTDLRSRNFDGTDDSIYTSTSYNNPLPTTYSVSLWFKTSSSNGRKLFGFESSQTGTGSGSWDRSIYIDSNGKIKSHGGNITSSSSYNDGSWHHVVQVFDNNANPKLTMFVDNVSIGSSNETVASYTGYWRIGSYKGGPANTSDGYFNGKIDEVRLYDRVLNPSEISRLYNGYDANISGALPSLSVNNLTITQGNFVAPTTLTITGNLSKTGGTFTHSDGTISLTAGSIGKTISGDFTGSSALYNIQFNSDSGSWSLGSDVDINGNLEILNGTITAPTGLLSIGGNFTQSGGGFNHGTGTVAIIGSNSPSIFDVPDNFTLNNLTSTATNKDIKFKAGSTVNFNGTVTLTGQNGNPIRVSSNNAGSTWTAYFSNAPTLRYVTFKDTACLAGSVGVGLNEYVFNEGNNGVCIVFVSKGGGFGSGIGGPSSPPVEAGSGGGQAQTGGNQGNGGNQTPEGGSGGGTGQTGGGSGSGGGGAAP